MGASDIAESFTGRNYLREAVGESTYYNTEDVSVAVATIGAGWAATLGSNRGSSSTKANTKPANQATSKALYQVTSKANAQQIAGTGKVASLEGGSKSLVYALNFQPTLSQAQNLGARSVETVIKFNTHASFEPDFTCGVNGALRSVFNGPINVFEVVEVGFK